jgi:triphosphoribosyl-dephospho-CoA synthase
VNIDELLKLELCELEAIRPTETWSLGTCVATACLLEAAAPKAGNVHPHASFSDMNYEHFRSSAQAIARVFDDPVLTRVGQLTLRAIEATQEAVGVNTNLGIVLLMAPIAIAFRRGENDHPRAPLDAIREWTSETRDDRLEKLKSLIRHELAAMSGEDSRAIYAAIRIAKAGGMGDVKEMDIHQEAPSDLLSAMQLASSWDDIAKEYSTGFHNLCTMSNRLMELLRSPIPQGESTKKHSWFRAIQHLQLERLAEHGDTLIARKNSANIVHETKRLAKSTCDDWETNKREASWQVLDDFLRDDGHRRNPGTTADLLAAATLLCILVEL